MRPLTPVEALGEETAKLVQGRRRLTQDAVGVMVDERDRAQYFAK
jgi:hypothetical protein